MVVDWSKLKVAELKEELKRRGLAGTGKKAELVARLVEFDAEHGSDKEGKGNEVPSEPAPPAKKQRAAPVDGSLDATDRGLGRVGSASEPAVGTEGTEGAASPDGEVRDARLEGVENSDGDDVALAAHNKPARVAGAVSCPYLSTINRRVLDFDFEKACSVRYACS